MISRATERQISEFIELLESHFARVKQEFHRRAKNMSRTDRDQLLTDALVIAFRGREKFDPALTSVGNWFHDCMELAVYENVVLDADEEALLKALTPDAPAGSTATATSIHHAGNAFDPTQKPGKECPPCWRCNYHQGWLPKKPLAPPTGNYGAMELLCHEIDLRKVEIAHYVRNEYPEFLED